jgi:predicted ribosomally synthesized peptide with SipW-like signal peptide
VPAGTADQPAMTTSSRHRDPRQRERAKGVITLVSALVIGLVASGATFSAFNAQTTSTANTFNTGTVSIADNDGGSVMFALSGMRPANPVNRCIQVTYTGTLGAAVKLYGTTTAGTGLESYLNLTVTRGTVSSGAFPSCTSFTADASGAVLYSGLMSAFPASLAAPAIADPNTSWATGEVHAYQFTVDVVDDNNAQNKNATETFTWDAR